MHFSNLKPYLLILRPGIFVGSFALVILSTIAATKNGFPLIAAILGAAGVAVTGSAGSVINDWCDVVGDEKNNPQRVLPSGLLTKDQALWYYLILLAVSLGLLWLVNIWAFTFGAVTSLTLFVYSFKLREWNGLASNMAIALSLWVLHSPLVQLSQSTLPNRLHSCLGSGSAQDWRGRFSATC